MVTWPMLYLIAPCIACVEYKNETGLGELQIKDLHNRNASYKCVCALASFVPFLMEYFLLSTFVFLRSVGFHVALTGFYFC